MIPAIIKRWEENKGQVEKTFREKHPDSYVDVVRAVVEAVKGEAYDEPDLDPDRIHTIDDGHYQGTLLFVVGAQGYQPSDYYAVSVGYGSCSGCDTLQAINGYSDDPPTDKQVSDYMTLALHIVQGLRHIAGYSLQEA